MKNFALERAQIVTDPEVNSKLVKGAEGAEENWKLVVQKDASDESFQKLVSCIADIVEGMHQMQKRVLTDS